MKRMVLRARTEPAKRVVESTAQLIHGGSRRAQHSYHALSPPHAIGFRKALQGMPAVVRFSRLGAVDLHSASQGAQQERLYGGIVQLLAERTQCPRPAQVSFPERMLPLASGALAEAVQLGPREGPRVLLA